MTFSKLDNTKVIFYEKPGCMGNAKQKKLLQSNNVAFEVRSILDTKWDKKTLESFFENLNIYDITNQFAPKVKNNQINLDTTSKSEMIEMMIKDPILIKRPLLVIGEQKICGFDIQRINSCLSINISTQKDIDSCSKESHDTVSSCNM